MGDSEGKGGAAKGRPVRYFFMNVIDEHGRQLFLWENLGTEGLQYAVGTVPRAGETVQKMVNGESGGSGAVILGNFDVPTSTPSPPTDGPKKEEACEEGARLAEERGSPFLGQRVQSRKTRSTTQSRGSRIPWKSEETPQQGRLSPSRLTSRSLVTSKELTPPRRANSPEASGESTCSNASSASTTSPSTKITAKGRRQASRSAPASSSQGANHRKRKSQSVPKPSRNRR